MDRKKRLLLLSKTMHLKSTENYKSVYIQDLTYQQQQEMILRRSKSVASRQGVAGDGGTRVGQEIIPGASHLQHDVG